jgi:DnaJ family protein C protein 28
MIGLMIDEIIRRAMEEGKFDDLPGKGKRLNLDEDPNLDQEWRAAHHILKSSGYSLPWIETRREIESGISTALDGLQRAWTWRQGSLAGVDDPRWVEAEWGRAQTAFKEQVAELNNRIRDYNLEVPSGGFHRPLVDADREIARVMRGE